MPSTNPKPAWWKLVLAFVAAPGREAIKVFTASGRERLLLLLIIAVRLVLCAGIVYWAYHPRRQG